MTNHDLLSGSILILTACILIYVIYANAISDLQPPSAPCRGYPEALTGRCQ